METDQEQAMLEAAATGFLCEPHGGMVTHYMPEHYKAVRADLVVLLRRQRQLERMEALGEWVKEEAVERARPPLEVTADPETQPAPFAEGQVLRRFSHGPVVFMSQAFGPEHLICAELIEDTVMRGGRAVSEMRYGPARLTATTCPEAYRLMEIFNIAQEQLKIYLKRMEDKLVSK